MAFQTYKPKTRPPSIKMSSVFNQLSETSSTSPSIGVLKTPSKRRSSTISLSNLFAQRKSLQTTAIATRRQSLWMDISKNPMATELTTAATTSTTGAAAAAAAIAGALPPSYCLENDYTRLIRKKFLRFLLVLSYLISISLLAIALATFYGFFWSGYSPTSATSNPKILDFKPTVRSLLSLTTNSSLK